MKFWFVILVCLLPIFHSSFSAFAQHQHQHGGMSMPGMPGMEGEKKMESAIGNEASTSRTFLVDGVKAILAGSTKLYVPVHEIQV